MGKVFSTQTDLTIKLNTGKNLADASSVYIKYKKPDRTTGQFAAVIVDEQQGIIQYAVTGSGQIDSIGRWTFWAKVVSESGLVSIGEPTYLTINREGN